VSKLTERASDTAAAQGPTSSATVFGWVAAGVAASTLFVAAVMQLTHGDGGGIGVAAAGLRFVRYVGSLTAVGGFVFAAFVRPPGIPVDRRGTRLGVAAATAAAVATVVSVPVQAGYLAADPASLVDPATVRAVLASGFGTSAMVGVLGLVLLVVGLTRTPAPVALAAGAAGCFLALGAFLLTGHTATSQPQAVVLIANLAHTAAAAVWLGGLVLLGSALRERRQVGDHEGGARLLGRFSTAATVALLAVSVAGGALAWVEVRAWSALTTPYGALLAAKVTLVAAVAALGAYNNRRLVPAVRAAADSGWSTLTRVVRWEVAGLVVVLAVTGVLVNIVPARVEAGIDAQVVRIASFGPEHTATLVVEPAFTGANEVHLYVEHERGVLGDVVEDVEIRFVPPVDETPAAVVAPAKVGPGHWLHLGDELTSAGEWVLDITGTVEGTSHSVSVPVPVADSSAW
jgi:copper transport protein